MDGNVKKNDSDIECTDVVSRDCVRHVLSQQHEDVKTGQQAGLIVQVKPVRQPGVLTLLEQAKGSVHQN